MEIKLILIIDYICKKEEAMSQIEFYSELLKLDPNWTVKEVKIDESSLIVFVCLDFIGKQGTCPFTGELSSIYDYSPERKWRHLDTMQYQTWVCS